MARDLNFDPRLKKPMLQGGPQPHPVALARFDKTYIGLQPLDAMQLMPATIAAPAFMHRL